MDRFIVGTGRCGSTLLSRMLAANPATCSVFEYFNGLDVFRRFSPQAITGAEFGALIGAEQKVVTAVLRRGYDLAEVTYPFAAADGSGGRHRREEGMPWILVSMLPRLCDDPDALFDEVIAFCAALPAQPAVAHHRALFDWLCRRFGRDHWIERAGSSIAYLGSLATHFPEARFLHIHRDGHEAALSMREHHAYRFLIAILYQAADGSGPSLSEIDFDAAPDPGDPISRILDGSPPIAYYGRYWNDQVLQGEEARRVLDPEQYCELRFEDLVAAPRSALEQICDFFELGSKGGWIDAAVALVRGAPPRRFAGLPADQQAELAAACRPGRDLLRQTQAGSARATRERGAFGG